MTQQPAGGPLSRFMRFTTQKEPVLSAAVVAAFVLYLVTRLVPGLTDDDLQLLGLLLVPIVPALLARLKAWSPVSAERAISEAFKEGQADGSANAVQPTDPVTIRRPRKAAP